MEVASLLDERDLTVVADVHAVCSGGFSDHDFHRSRRHGNIFRLFCICGLPQRFHDPVCLILFHQGPVQFQVYFRAFSVISLSILCMEDARSVIRDQSRSGSAAQDLCQDLFKLFSAEHICLLAVFCTGAVLIILLGLISAGLILSEGLFQPGIEGFHGRRCIFLSKGRIFHRLLEDEQEFPAQHRAVRCILHHHARDQPCQGRKPCCGRFLLFLCSFAAVSNALITVDCVRNGACQFLRRQIGDHRDLRIRTVWNRLVIVYQRICFRSPDVDVLGLLDPECHDPAAVIGGIDHIEIMLFGSEVSAESEPGSHPVCIFAELQVTVISCSGK